MIYIIKSQLVYFLLILYEYADTINLISSFYYKFSYKLFCYYFSYFRSAPLSVPINYALHKCYFTVCRVFSKSIF